MKKNSVITGKTLKTSKEINCTSIEDAREKNYYISNGVIVEKDGQYLVVNYKRYEQLKPLGYKQVR